PPRLALLLCLSHGPAAHRARLSFPTRRSSDLGLRGLPVARRRQFDWAGYSRRCRSSGARRTGGDPPPPSAPPASCRPSARSSARDRKSTRLNSSHVKISYAVFCLKKKTPKRQG